MVSFDEYRQAHLDFFECLESVGGHADWSVIDDYGQPEIFYAVTWDTYVGDMTPEEREVALERLNEDEGFCENQHDIAAIRAAYQKNPGAETARRLSWDERWEQGLPAVVECFAAAGANVDPSTTRAELRALWMDEYDGTPGLLDCMKEAGVVVDTGDGFFEMQF